MTPHTDEQDRIDEQREARKARNKKYRTEFIITSLSIVGLVLLILSLLPE